MSRPDYEPPIFASDRFRDDELEQYDPIHPQGISPLAVLRKIWALVVGLVLAVVKFGAFSIKFFGIFISVAGYALIFGWKFAVGFVLLILVHEMGHYVEARRQGLHPALPVFIPFLGAYVAIKDAPRNDPFRHGLIAAAGPFAGGLAALACGVYAVGADSRFMYALAYSGFFLNLINLLPIPALDGGFLLNAVRTLRSVSKHPYAPPQVTRARTWGLGAIYVGLAVALALGMWWAHIPQDRL